MTLRSELFPGFGEQMKETLPLTIYKELMATIRFRFDSIHILKDQKAEQLFVNEIAAFQGRKIVECIAFACLVSVKKGLNKIPVDAKGQYKAGKIFKSLEKKNLKILPSPSVLRPATLEERKQYNVNVTIDGIPNRRLTHDELCKIYKRFNEWAHELNPYVFSARAQFEETHSKNLWNDIEKLELFVERHAALIRGKGFFCVLRDKTDGKTKVIALSKIGDL